MDCPKCSSPAYLSLLGDIECSNEKCEHYSSSLYPKKEEPKKPDTETTDSLDADVSEDRYLWSTYHNDFGDI